MKCAAVHAANACVRLISVLCLVVGCFSLTCGEGEIVFDLYSPVVTGCTCQPKVNGQYTYKGKHNGNEMHMNQHAMRLFKTTNGNYIFSVTTLIPGSMAVALTYSSGADAGVIPARIAERCVRFGVLIGYTFRENAFAPNGTTTCTCDTGWTPVEGVCEQCIAGKYKRLVATFECRDCPVSSNSSVGSKALEDCACNAGLTGPNGGVCTACGPAIFAAIVTGFTCRTAVNGQYTYLDQYGGGEQYQHSYGDLMLYKLSPETEYVFVFSDGTLYGRTNSEAGVVNASGITSSASDLCVSF